MMEKMTGESLDLTQENIKRLKELFPEVLTEKKIDFDKLRLILGDEVETSPERYEFRWNGKNEAIKLSQTPSMGTLRPDKESSKHWDTTENLYIEGDNLEVLKLLQKSYFGKIKMIYIDPPYNTGKDFVYKDNFHDNIANYKEITNQSTKANTESNGRFHTDWLNMMYPRLRLARNLLSDEGLIIISIDGYEINNIRKICEEIFGEENVLQEVIWQRHLGGGNDSKFFAVDHEYLLVCAKNKSLLKNLRIPLNDEDKKEFKEKDEHYAELGPYKTKDFRRMRADDPRPTLQYNIIAPDGEVLFNEWRWEEDKFKTEYHNNKVQIRKGKNDKWIVEYKIYLNSNLNGEERSKVPRSLLVNIDKNSDGKKQLKELLKKDNLFNNPKPLGLLEYFIQMVNTDDIILDFFSGVSSTAHAVLDLNSKDNIRRKYIMVQLPELTEKGTIAKKEGYSNICEIAKERIRRAGDKILKESNTKDLDIGFKVFKLDDSNIKTWDSNTKDIENTLFNSIQNLKENRTQEDLLYELMLKMGIELTAKIEKVNVNGKVIYNIQSGGLVICLEDEITKEIIDAIPTLKSPFMDMKVVFKEYGFKADADKMNAIQNLKQHGIKDVRSV